MNKTINITIDKLIDKVFINKSDIDESTKQVEEKIAEALTKAIRKASLGSEEHYILTQEFHTKTNEFVKFLLEFVSSHEQNGIYLHHTCISALITSYCDGNQGKNEGLSHDEILKKIHLIIYQEISQILKLVSDVHHQTACKRVMSSLISLDILSYPEIY